MSDIKKAAVIGAGVMGAGIAAHIANAGIPVVLLDIVLIDAANRNAIAEDAIKKMLKTEPAPFMSKRAAKLVTPGNIEDHMDWLADCDWIVEAVIERLDIKQDLYAKIGKVKKPGAVLSSNTSTIPLKNLTDAMDDALVPDFMITHFFNPPRYMRLLEIVASDKTTEEAVDAIHAFCDMRLGKGVIHAKDTPGFVANRIGTYWFQLGLTAALDLDLTVDEADAIGSRPFGIPKSGFFGTLDLVGLDLMPHVAESMLERLPQDDPYRDIHSEPEVVQTMLTNGWIGRKGPGGFYRLDRSDGKRVKESINLRTAAYSPSQKATLESLKASKAGGVRALVEHEDKGGQFAWRLVSQALPYAASLVPEISDTIVDVDAGMKDGYGWTYGPFELADQMGAAWLANKLKADGIETPPMLSLAAEKGGFYRVENGVRQYLTTQGDYVDAVRPDGVLSLLDVKLASESVLKNGSASVWDIGDGVLCFEFTSKMNSLDPDIMALYKKTIKLIKNSESLKALVIYNEGSNFSVGANLGLFLFAANIALWPEIESQIEDGQKTYMSLKQAPFPVVAAPSGMALGGGCEILLHADAVQAHAETYTGLVEVGVGIIPGWGGCKEVLLRLQNHPSLPRGPMPAVAKAFEMIGTAQVAKSALEATEMGLFRDSDAITMNRDRLLADAKTKALSLAENYAPPEEQELVLPGPTGRAAMQLALQDLALKGTATPHDQVVAGGLSEVLTGGDTDMTETLTEKEMLKLERTVFMKLARTGGTLARMEHMLDTGKPLRN
ncbi:MAG: 3-hydroxyacyl-CoA dehydrogenase NAD-binding domain-containing protein [Rhodospirillaceae bacterium]|nr:3-hydroxyacyl-CoA dehydrogenase NAD-binding domain-containing protein [Rhodospirillaceae bacterium]